MRFQVLIDEAAERDYRGLPLDMRERVKQRLVRAEIFEAARGVLVERAV